LSLIKFTNRLASQVENNDIIKTIITNFNKIYKEECDNFIIDKGSYPDSLRLINKNDIKYFCDTQDANLAEKIANKLQELHDLDDDMKWELADNIAFYLYDLNHTHYDTFIENFYSSNLEDILDIIQETLREFDSE